MNALFYDGRDSLGFMTITANRMLRALLRRKMAEAGIDLTADQWGVLAMIWNRGDATQEELAREAAWISPA